MEFFKGKEHLHCSYLKRELPLHVLIYMDHMVYSSV